MIIKKLIFRKILCNENFAKRSIKQKEIINSYFNWKKSFRNS